MTEPMEPMVSHEVCFDDARGFCIVEVVRQVLMDGLTEQEALHNLVELGGGEGSERE